jgi:hypothetical protein
MIQSIIPPTSRPCALSSILILLVTSAQTAAFASRHSRVSIDEPQDRRTVDETEPTDSLSAEQLRAKKDEAAAMVKWFEGSLRVHEAELEAHLIEVKYNKLNVENLRNVSGSIAGVRIEEAELQVAKDAVFTRQLETEIEMAKADLEAARARMRYLNAAR